MKKEKKKLRKKERKRIGRENDKENFVRRKRWREYKRRGGSREDRSIAHGLMVVPSC